MLPDSALALADPARHFVVTGGGGWLGRAALTLLEDIYGDDLARRVAVFGERERLLILGSGRALPSRPFAALRDFAAPAPIVLHFASLGRSPIERMPLAHYVALGRALSAEVAALVARCGAKGFLLPSSGAVYRPDRTLDDDLAGNPYGVLKREDEVRFGDCARRHGFPAVVLRIFNLSGHFMTHPHHYALGAILGDVLAGRPVEIRAAHKVVRAYVHVGDVLALGLGLLARGEPAGPLDTGGQPAIEIGDLARRAAALLGRPDLPIRRPPCDGAPADIYVGDGARFAALAAGMGMRLRTLDEQIVATAAFLGSAA